jgi:phosphoglycolate phosphatase
VKKTIIFDFDGTIADSFDIIENILINLSGEFGYRKPTEEEIEEFKTKHPKEIMKILGLSAYKAPFLLLRVKSEMQKRITDIKPIHGMAKALTRLKSNGYTLGIVTSNGEKNVQLFLEENNPKVFDFVQTESSLFDKAKGTYSGIKKTKNR